MLADTWRHVCSPVSVNARACVNYQSNTKLARTLLGPYYLLILRRTVFSLKT